MAPDQHLNGGVDIQSVLTARGLLSGAALERVRRLEAESGERIDLIAAKLGLISDRDLAQAYASMVGSELLGPHEFPAEPVAPDRLRAAFLKRARIIPIAETDAAVVVAMADPLDAASVRAVEFATGKAVERRAAVPTDIDAAHDRLYGEGRSAIDHIYEAAGERDDSDRDSDLERLKDLASEAPVIRLVNTLITRAVEMVASDIHLESTETELRVRYRVDGMLREMDSPPARLRSAIISRVKIMAKLNIAERRLPQDGRIRLAVRGKEIDFRVSTTPAIHGESVVLRILDRGSLALDFTALGFDDTQLPKFLEALMRPHGIVLVSGPDRQRQDHHAVRGADQTQFAGPQDPDGGKPGRIRARRHQSGADESGNRPDLRQRAAQLPAPGPRHHDDRRNPQSGNRADRRAGGADRPPRALHRPHQRRRQRHDPAARHGHRELSAQFHHQRRAGPAPGAAAVRRAAASRIEPEPELATSLDLASAGQDGQPIAVSRGRLSGLQRARLCRAHDDPGA